MFGKCGFCNKYHSNVDDAWTTFNGTSEDAKNDVLMLRTTLDPEDVDLDDFIAWSEFESMSPAYIVTAIDEIEDWKSNG